MKAEKTQDQKVKELSEKLKQNEKNDYLSIPYFKNTIDVLNDPFMKDFCQTLKNQMAK